MKTAFLPALPGALLVFAMSPVGALAVDSSSVAGLLPGTQATLPDAGISGANLLTVGADVDCDFANLQAAINAAPDGAVIHLMSSYASTPRYLLVDKSLTIHGGYSGCDGNRQRVARTTLDAQGDGAVMSVANFGGASQPSRQVELAYLDITGGAGDDLDRSGGLTLLSQPGAVQLRLHAVRVHGNTRAGTGNHGAGLHIFSNGAVSSSQVGGVLDPMVLITGDSRFEGNSSDGVGGGIYCRGDGNPTELTLLWMVEGVIQGNSAVNGGGAGISGCRNVVFSNAGPFVNDSPMGGFVDNSATLNGGAIYVTDGGQVRLTGGSYQGSSTRYAALLAMNTAGSGGGAAQSIGAGSELVLIDTWVLDNQAVALGGGLLVGAGGQLLMDSDQPQLGCAEGLLDPMGRFYYPPCSVIQGNAASGGGGLNLIGDGQARILRTHLRFNQAAGAGGSAVRLSNSNLWDGPSSRLDMIGSLIHDNSGAAVIDLGIASLADITHSTISHHPGLLPFRLSVSEDFTAVLNLRASIVAGEPLLPLAGLFGSGSSFASAECVLGNLTPDSTGFSSLSLYQQGEPRFRDPAIRDFRLLDDSPAIDFCYATLAPDELSPDLAGQPRGQLWQGPMLPPNPGSGPFDLGAYEAAFVVDGIFADRFQ